MQIENYLVLFFWIIFMVVWAVTAIGTKKTLKRNFWSKVALVRIGAILVFLYLFHAHVFTSFAQNPLVGQFLQNPVTQVFGVVLCGIGIALAVWARLHLGKNWGQPMSIKEKPNLISRGPYAHIRHPIYSGISLAILGSCLAAGEIPADSLFWLVVFITTLLYFFFSAKEEEKIMIKEFPQKYPEYMKKTYMLIPFLY